MHTIKITPNLLFKYQCTSGKFIRLLNQIKTFFCQNWNALGVISFCHPTNNATALNRT